MEVLIESSNVEVKPVARRGANSQNANRYDTELQKQCVIISLLTYSTPLAVSLTALLSRMLHF